MRYSLWYNLIRHLYFPISDDPLKTSPNFPSFYSRVYPLFNTGIKVVFTKKRETA